MRNILISVPGKKEKLPLSVTHPELAKEANGWDPTVITSGSGKKCVWECPLGHSYQASVSHRTNMGSGCPYCAGKKILIGFNDLGTTHPEIAQQASGWDPGSVSAGSGKKLPWKCSQGHIFESTIANRTSQNRGTGCPVCVNKRVIQGVNDLATKNPELVAQADGWDPKSVTPGSSKKLNWRCPIGHKFEATPAARTGEKKSGCPVCSNRKLLSGFNDLLTTHPHIAIEANGWDATHYFAGSPKKLDWLCPLGHPYQASISNRTSRKSGCPTCDGKKVVTGYNDLATRFPEIAAEADGWDPSIVSSGTHTKMKWLCPKNHQYESSIAHRTSSQSRGCPVCAGKILLIGFNDLASNFPSLALEADGWDPKTISAGNDRKMPWKCPLGHRYESAVGSRSNLKTGCPVCDNKKLLKGFNDLATTNPLISLEAVGWDPSEYFAGTSKKMKWRCSAGHQYLASIAHRTHVKPTGCPTCGKYGYDPSKEGFLYLLNHPDWLMLQIGITNFPDARLGSHKKLGWNVIELRGPMDGHLTQQWETAILRMLKAKGADLSNSKIAGKFDGYSEAWSKSTFEVKSIKELMRLTEKFEEK